MYHELPLIFMVVGLPVICTTIIILAILFFVAKWRQKSGGPSKEETKLMQEMHQTLTRLEKRIDALETIYFETERERTSNK